MFSSVWRACRREWQNASGGSVRFGSDGSCSFVSEAGSLVYVTLRGHFLCAFLCDPQRWAIEAQRSDVLLGNKNLQVSQRRGSSLACMILQMCYFEREVSSESEV